MNASSIPPKYNHSHVFLGADHARNEKRTWAVIWLCGFMMIVEIGGGLAFGSVALIADGLHMSTHAGALFLAAMAYSYARTHANDARFTFGTGKMGDLAAFASAIVLAMISLLIAYEALMRFFAPAPIDFPQAISIATLGLLVNIASVWILGGGGHTHGHAHGHSHGHSHDHDEQAGHGVDETKELVTPYGPLRLAIHEDGVPPRFQLLCATPGAPPERVMIETQRPDGKRQAFAMRALADRLESIDEIPEPHDFIARVRLEGKLGFSEHEALFKESDHDHAAHHVAARDNNMRAAFVHVLADAAVSLLVIGGLSLAWIFGWVWIDPLVGMVGAIVVANWAYGLMRDAGAILLDMNPDRGASDRIRRVVEENGDRVADLHVWRLGPGHLGAIVEIESREPRSSEFYRERLAHMTALSHLTIEVRAG
ncbi:MAG TPA: CDF family Co(II)/Ni(II) efflux transporter DmeF [Beijerinckiaceae bacterium]|nr:CDF family Co(II)/Ni(II) efflux transporter DmeF [Beijerinckiaceae bacterium]